MGSSKNYIFEKFSINGEGVPEITPSQLSSHTQKVQLIDVRRPDEFTGELGHIEGSVLSTLEGSFGSDLTQWPKEDTYVIICRSGARSSRATAYMLGQGFKTVYNLEGGMIAWNSSGLPIKK